MSIAKENRDSVKPNVITINIGVLNKGERRREYGELGCERKQTFQLDDFFN